MCNSVCSNIKCHIFCSWWIKSVHDKMIFQSIIVLAWQHQLYWQFIAQERAYKSQHEAILADLNWYTTATPLVVILTNDAIKHTCVWSLVWHSKYKSYNSSTPLQWFFTFLFSSQGKVKQCRMKDSP